MKTMKDLRQMALLLAISFCCVQLLALPSSNAFTSSTDEPALMQEGPNKKCRRCVRWRPDRFFKKGQWDVAFGLGVMPTFLMDKARMIVPPISLGLEYRFNEKFSLGTMVGHSISESEPKIVSDGVNATWTNRFYHIALRPAVHVTGVEDWDFCGGFSVGMQLSDVKGQASSPDVDLAKIEGHLGIGGKKVSAAFSGFLGLRYVVSPRWTIGAEAGFSVSILTIGVTHLLNG